MSVRSGQVIGVVFVTSSFSSGAATNADSLPTGTLYLNGVANAAVVTVTNLDAGRYRASVTLPTLAVGDVVELSIAATVGAVVGKGVVWRDTKDLAIDAAGLVDDARLANLDATVSSRADAGALDDALVALRLDELLTVSADLEGANPPVSGSVFFELMSKPGTFSFRQATDSLEAIRDQQGAVVLSPAGLDAVAVESGLNARQALAIIASASAGVLAGAGTSAVTIAAAGVPAQGRVAAAVDGDGNRLSVSLTPPA